MLIDVLTRLAEDTGYHPEDQRSILISLLNRAANDMHKRLECNKIHRETTLAVSSDCIAALPSFIGELKGMRMHTSELPFDLHSIATPRYLNSTLSFKYKNWRDLGESAIHTIPSTVGTLSIVSSVVEDTPVKLLISAQTDLANKIEESVTLDASTKVTTHNFGPTFYKIACLTPRTGNITINDSNGNEIAILYNNENATRYKLVDVSQVFWSQDTSEGETFIDVAYKVKTTRLNNDTDSFYAGDDYDEAWYHWALYLYYKPLQGREQAAADEFQTAIVSMEAVKDSGEGEIVKQLSFGRNKFYGLFRRYRYVPGSVTNVDAPPSSGQ